MRAYKVVVPDTPVELIPADSINRPFWLQIDGNATVYIGHSNVTVAQGFPIAKHTAPIQGVLGVGDTLWGICSPTVTETIRIFTIDSD